MNSIATRLSFLGGALLLLMAAGSGDAAEASDTCAHDTGLSLPTGFCATLFADHVGHARHLVVAPSGVVYVNTWSGRYYGNEKPPLGGFLVALQDSKNTGSADVIKHFGATTQTGGHGGTGIGIFNGFLYAEINDKIVKYRLPSAALVPEGAPVDVVTGLPLSGDHPMHPFAIDSTGALLVDVASATNACQQKNRQLKSPGLEPCVELETRGGVWRYDANKTGQAFSPADRYATGIRNGEGFAVDNGAHRLFVTQHGRDQLHTNWPDIIKDPTQEATLPSEELMLLKSGGDYGWPQCYYDPFVNRLVLAPEYGGDGQKAGLCADKLPPVAAYPAHWAPNAALFYGETKFPSHYHQGIFIAFHGSWNRAPYAQGGYNVVFQPMNGEHTTGNCEIFADGFAGGEKSPDNAPHRPSGLALGPDGALYVSDDIGGRIYRITYKAGSNPAGATVACPSNTLPAEAVSSSPSGPPEGTHANAGREAPLPSGITRAMVAMGDKIYHGEGGATCTGCHGAKGTGSPLGPDLSAGHFLWSDGSVAGLASVISKGVAEPKQYRAPMPAMGGAQLSSEQVNALAAYVWTLSHSN